MSIADLVERMLAANVPHDVIVLAVRTVEGETSAIIRGESDKIIEKRRAADRARKHKKYHDKKVSGPAVSTPATAKTSVDSPRINPPDTPHRPTTTLSLVSFEKDSDSEQGSQKERKKERAGKKLSADWQPKDSHYEAAAKFGIDHEGVHAIADDMRIWAGANGNRAVTTKSDWDLTFHGFIRRFSRERKNRSPPQKRGFLDLALEFDRSANDRNREDQEFAFDATNR